MEKITEIEPKENNDSQPEASPQVAEISWREIANFYRKGNGVSSIPVLSKTNESEGNLIPALIAQYHYLDHSQVRFDYPLVLVENSPEANETIITLMQLFDGLINELVEESDEGGKLRQNILRLEAEIKSQLFQNGADRLSNLWDKAAKNLLATADESENEESEENKKETLQQNLQIVRQALKVKGKVIPCNNQTPVQLLTHIWNRFWQEKSSTFRAELDELIIKLTDVLRTDDVKTEEARKPENLEASLGSGDINFEVLSTLLSESHPAEPLPKKRRQRIQTALDTLKNSANFFADMSADKILINDCLTAKKALFLLHGSS